MRGIVAALMLALSVIVPATQSGIAIALPLTIPTADISESSVPGLTVTATKGAWSRTYPDRDPCNESSKRCDYEADGLDQPPIPDRLSPLGAITRSDPVANIAAATASPQMHPLASAGPRDLTLVLGKDVDTTKASGFPLDTSVAAAGKKVVFVQNATVSVSVDYGATFSTPRAVSSLYPDSPDGGVCCDMVLTYVPAIDRFVWVTQYKPGPDKRNRYRLAVFSPSAITATGISKWTYWDITANSLPGVPGFLDFPEMSFGNTFLYLSFHAGSSPPAVTNGVIVRIGLGNLKAGGDLAAQPTPWRFFVGAPFMGAVVQNTGSRAYWASNTSNSTVNVGWWDESSILVAPTHSLTIFNWPNADYTSQITLNGDQWLNTYQGLILGAARSEDSLYFAWTAARGYGPLSWLSQPHVQLLTLSGANSGSLALQSQRALYNSAYAIAYPNLNVMNGDVALTFTVGGATMWPNSAIMDITATPTTFQSFTSGTASCLCGRWGDYAAIRPWPRFAAGRGTPARIAFVASGYSVHPVALPTGVSQLRQVGAIGALAQQ